MSICRVLNLLILFFSISLSSMNNKESVHRAIIIKMNNRKDQCEQKTEYVKAPLSGLYFKQRTVTLSDALDKGYPLVFEQFKENYITQYILKGKPIAKLLQIDDAMSFTSSNKKPYDFLLQNALRVGSLTVDTQGAFGIQKQIQAHSASLTGKSVNFFEKFFCE